MKEKYFRSNLSIILYYLYFVFSLFSPTFATAQLTKIYTYDARGRMTVVEDALGWKTTYGHDRADNRATVVMRNQFESSYLARDMYHQNGYLEWGGWAANTSTPPSLIVYGPYTTSVSAGSRVATWRMITDNVAAQNGEIARLDVYDATTGSVVAQRSVYRHDWKAAFSRQIFELPFQMTPSLNGHAIEFRVFYVGTAYINIDYVGYY